MNISRNNLPLELRIVQGTASVAIESDFWGDDTRHGVAEVFTCRQMYVSQWLLPRSSVEIKIALETVQPVRGMIVLVDGWHGIGAHLNLYGITAAQFLPVLAVKGHRRFGSGIVGNVASQDDVIRKHHGTKRQDVRTNWCQKDTLLFQRKNEKCVCERESTAD